MNFDVLTMPVDDTLVGMGLLGIAGVTTVWGIVLLFDAFAADRRRLRPLSPARLVVPTFGYWLGMFLLFSDAGIYAILGFSVLSKPSGMELWAFVYAVVCTILAAVAFVAWARERRSA